VSEINIAWSCMGWGRRTRTASRTASPVVIGMLFYLSVSQEYKRSPTPPRALWPIGHSGLIFCADGLDLDLEQSAAIIIATSSLPFLWV
jgi:hypothetical protein